MLSLFSCCCHRRQLSSDDLNGPDERSHLIPATSEDLVSPTSLGLSRSYIDDHQRMKERMGSIVRAKEGKMVNVNARLPFNLHNHPSGSGSGSIHAHPSSSSSLSLSSSSRSLSAAALSAPPTHPPNSGTPHTHAQVQVHVGAPLPGPSTYTRAAPHQRDPADLSRSSSAASRDTGASEGSLARRRHTPILGLRLVRVPMPGAGTVGRRGRRKRKTGGGGGGAEEGVSPQERNPADSVGSGAGEMPLDVGVGTEELGTPRPRRTSQPQVPLDENVSPPSMSGSEAEMTPRVEHPNAWAISVSPASEDSGRGVGSGKGADGASSFVLKDEGPLTVSWGD